jgi:hypothetical protein
MLPEASVTTPSHDQLLTEEMPRHLTNARESVIIIYNNIELAGTTPWRTKEQT